MKCTYCKDSAITIVGMSPVCEKHLLIGFKKDVQKVIDLFINLFK